MKYYLILLLLLFSKSLISQVRVDFGAGFSNQNTAAAELNVNVSSKDYFAQIGYVSHLSRSIDKGVFFNFSSGMLFYWNDKIRLAPSVGVYYHLKNSDVINLNTTGVMISQKIYKKMDSKNDFFVNFVVAERAAFLTAGISGSLVPDKKIPKISQTYIF